MISTDDQALLLLCSHLGLSSQPVFSPLTLREWNPIEQKLQSINLSPGNLLDLSASDLRSKLDITENESDRLAHLLERSGMLAITLERLNNLGIFAITRMDPDYPERYRQRLKDSAPVVLFYSGEKTLLGQPGIAVVGSRDLDDTGKECAAFIGNLGGTTGMVVYSGGARGADSISMEAALDANGTAVGVLADSLERATRVTQEALSQGNLCLVTPYSPNSGFSVGTAMGRNRLIYTLADFAIVIASNAKTGGTWSGATEALKNRWIPVFALEHDQMPEGNKLLLQKGAIALPYPFQETPLKLLEWMKQKATTQPSLPTQRNLF